MNLAQLIDFERIERHDAVMVKRAAPVTKTVHSMRTPDDLPLTRTEIKALVAAGAAPADKAKGKHSDSRQCVAARVLRDHRGVTLHEFTALVGLPAVNAAELLCRLVRLRWAKKAGARRFYRYSASALGLSKC